MYGCGAVACAVACRPPPPPFSPVVLMCAELMCAKLEIANAKTIRYSDPKGAHGERQEGSRATYTCMPGFAKAGNKDSRVCKSGKFDGAQQLCVGELCVCEGRVVVNKVYRVTHVRA